MNAHLQQMEKFNETFIPAYPIVAMLFDGENTDEVIEWTKGSPTPALMAGDGYGGMKLAIPSLHCGFEGGLDYVTEGRWIVKNEADEFFSMHATKYAGLIAQ